MKPTRHKSYFKARISRSSHLKDNQKYNSAGRALAVCLGQTQASATASKSPREQRRKKHGSRPRGALKHTLAPALSFPPSALAPPTHTLHNWAKGKGPRTCNTTEYLPHACKQSD
jgi:hypothetical protein